ncbi:fatty-acid--CoA ligase [Mycolicibacterium vinylchloridicum]|uniref:fatty-acid--CoA ligase n=1 Tax=Mycolicibacterium vinylchloridicum TaxID=2736928 RepID=UPI0015CA7F5C|nr:fatty-acid--CoA ligase [Mycolicibacterium vinylchloridicum]
MSREIPVILLAMEFSIPEPDRVRTVLDRNRDTLGALGAHQVVVHHSDVEPTRVLTTIGFRSRQPMRQLLGSHYLLDWFDAVGLDEVPAVFAGDIVFHNDTADPSPLSREFIVAAIFPVPEPEAFVVQVKASLARFRRYGIRKVRVYQAFDDRRELMLLLTVDNQAHAHLWLSKSDAAAAWLTSAGVGIYPPVFLGSADFAIHFPAQRPGR